MVHTLSIATVAEVLGTGDTSNYVLSAVRAALIRAKVTPAQGAA